MSSRIAWEIARFHRAKDIPGDQRPRLFENMRKFLRTIKSRSPIVAEEDAAATADNTASPPASAAAPGVAHSTGDSHLLLEQPVALEAAPDRSPNLSPSSLSSAVTNVLDSHSNADATCCPSFANPTSPSSLVVIPSNAQHHRPPSDSSGGMVIRRSKSDTHVGGRDDGDRSHRLNGNDNGDGGISPLAGQYVSTSRENNVAEILDVSNGYGGAMERSHSSHQLAENVRVSEETIKKDCLHYERRRFSTSEIPMGGIPTPEAMEQEIDFLEKQFQAAGLPILFCHNDLQSGASRICICSKFVEFGFYHVCDFEEKEVHRKGRHEFVCSVVCAI